MQSSIHVQIKSTFGSQLEMNNVTVETNSLQNWVDDMIWRLTTDLTLVNRQRNNVAVKYLGGHQKIRKIESVFK